MSQTVTPLRLTSGRVLTGTADMLRFTLEVGKDWHRAFKNLWMRAGTLGKWKAWEVQAYKSGGLFSVELNIAGWGRGQAGPGLTLGVLGYYFTASIYDVRQWDYECNKFIDDYRNT